MITAEIGNKLLVVLEPGNIDLLQIGRPIAVTLPKDATEIVIGYTPDMVWMANEIKNGRSLIEVMLESLTRSEVHSRPYHERESRTDIKV